MKKWFRIKPAIALLLLLVFMLTACSVPEDENKLSDITQPVSGEPSTDLNRDAYTTKLEKIKSVLEKYYMGDIDYDKAMEYFWKSIEIEQMLHIVRLCAIAL